MTITAKGKVRHNGKDYKKGDEIPGLKKDETKRLLDLDAAEDSAASEKDLEGDKKE